MKREMSVAGSFYPEKSSEVQRYFEHFTKVYNENFTLPDALTKAIIVPHAGYIYSGYTANIAFRVLKKSNLKNVLVIGPSHRMAFEGVSICNYDSYETPLGDINSASTLAIQIKEKFNLPCIEQAHQEHSTEVQFPFLKHYMDDVNIIELVYSDANPLLISEIINFVLEKKDCGVVISTDLSHFYTIEDANKLDNICLNAIDNLDTSMLDTGCEACGKIGLKAMLLSGKKMDLNSNILDYRTSADASNDTSRVVGYLSAYFD